MNQTSLKQCQENVVFEQRLHTRKFLSDLREALCVQLTAREPCIMKMTVFDTESH